MSDHLAQTRENMLKALQRATLNHRIDWIRTNPDEVKWKEGTVEQRYAMISEEGVFATLTRLRDGGLELVIQVQEAGCYREYEITKADGAGVAEQLQDLYNLLPSTGKMIDDFNMIIEHLGPVGEYQQ
jgi:hypothetical protein